MNKIRNKIKIYSDRHKDFKKLYNYLKSVDNIYIVGGFIRDTLIGIDTDDIDFLYDGNLKMLFTILIKQFKCNYTFNDRFLTGVLTLGKTKFDFATTREEKYLDSGKLPIVKHCPLTEDFKRRDFTINAIVWDIKHKKMIDPLNGFEDIKSRLLRVIYKTSFRDDPTRIIRGLRFSGKFGLNMDNETIKCYNESTDNNYLSRISNRRITRELDYIYHENSFFNILHIISNLGVFYQNEHINGKNFKELEKHIPANNLTAFRKDIMQIYHINDQNIRRIYSDNIEYIELILSSNTGNIFDNIYFIYRKYGIDMALRAFIYYKCDKKSIDEIGEKLKVLNKLINGHTIKAANSKIDNEYYSSIIRITAIEYLKGELKNKEEITNFINNMEVIDGKPHT